MRIWKAKALFKCLNSNMSLSIKTLRLKIPALIIAVLISGTNSIAGQPELTANDGLQKPVKSQLAADSDWVGEYRIKDINKVFKIHIRGTAAEGMKMTYDTLPQGPRGIEPALFSTGAGFVKFDIKNGSTILNFSGNIKDKKITGEVVQDAERGTFEMIQTVSLNPELLKNYAGSYQTASGKLIRISKDGGYTGDDPTFLEYTSQRFGPLFPLSETGFFSGQNFSANLFPMDVRISFVKNGGGEITGLNYQEGKSPAALAKRLNFKEEEITFNTGDVKLAGTLTLPLTRGPYPVIEFVHGSPPENREFGFWRTFFASHGIAVFAYDKRGVGASTGDWRKADFEDAAADVLNGIQVLKSRKDIDSGRIGLWGISQAGWVVPIAATRSKDISFIILHSGAMITPYQQSLQAITSELQVYGASEQEINDRIEYSKIDQEFTRSGQGWERLQQLYQTGKAKNANWAYEPMPKDFWFRNWYRATMDFDSVPYWEKVKCPVLAFFGELDMTVRPEPSRDILTKALTKAGNKDFSTVVLPKASHGYLEVQTGIVRNDLPRVKKFAGGYFETMAKWLDTRISAKK